MGVAGASAADRGRGSGTAQGVVRAAKHLQCAIGTSAQPHCQNKQATEFMSSAIQEVEALLGRELGRVIVGAEASIRALIIALVARGHVLVQGVPGLGKTLLAKTLARSLGGEFKR